MPPAASGLIRGEVIGERRLRLQRHLQVARQQVIKRRHVGRALNRRMSTQREDAASGPSDVAEQELQDRRRADVLYADGMLCPANSVAEGGRAIPPGVRRDRLGDTQEDVLWRAADLLDQ